MKKEIILKTERLAIKPNTIEKMEEIYEAEAVPEMKQAYAEMIEEMKKLKGNEEWGAEWTISLLKSGEEIGGICFKGMADEAGSVEVGYGIDEKYQHNGYATEAVGAVVKWALKQKGVKFVTAETEESNKISQKVLKNNGFKRDGVGEEGPLFKIQG